MRSLLPQPMKIASFNINNINRRLTNLLNWLHEAEPDIVCLQEIKAADTEFPTQAIRQAGYHAVCHGERRWNRSSSSVERLSGMFIPGSGANRIGPIRH
jgi:exonuclease III